MEKKNQSSAQVYRAFDGTSLIAWHLEPHESLNLVHDYAVPADTDYAVTVQFFLAPSSSLTYVPIITGGATVRLTLEIILEEHAQAAINGIYCIEGQQEYHIITKQQHRASHATSALRMNGIATGRSMLNYSGIIAIDKNASKTQASQENKTLLLGAQARAISIPALEVLNNDVHCAHGSAMSSFDADHLWYMQSRGLPMAQAKQLLVASFLEQALDGKIVPERHETVIQSLVDKVLNAKEQ